jgi:hypothetical protein
MIAGDENYDVIQEGPLGLGRYGASFTLESKRVFHLACYQIFIFAKLKILD